MLLLAVCVVSLEIAAHIKVDGWSTKVKSPQECVVDVAIQMVSQLCIRTIDPHMKISPLSPGTFDDVRSFGGTEAVYIE